MSVFKYIFGLLAYLAEGTPRYSGSTVVALSCYLIFKYSTQRVGLLGAEIQILCSFNPIIWALAPLSTTGGAMVLTLPYKLVLRLAECV